MGAFIFIEMDGDQSSLMWEVFDVLEVVVVQNVER